MGFRNLNNYARYLVSTLGLVLLVSATAYAYTVVMKGGKRIEIPNLFAVTRTTVTYGVAPGMNVTIQLSAIDIQATEHANNEPPGSFLQRAESTTAATQTTLRLSRTQARRRVVTDRDLERYKRARLDNEAAYEKHRIEFGLPSLEELRRRAAQETELAQAKLAQRRIEQAREESYWRARATELRSEIAATNAEISYISAAASESCCPGLSPLLVWQGSALNSANRDFVPPRPGVFVAPASQLAIAGGRGPERGQVFVNPAARAVRSSNGNGPRLGSAGIAVGGLFGQPYDVAYEQSASAQLGRLFSYRAGLEARMRALEEEARRAGVPPGWLRE